MRFHTGRSTQNDPTGKNAGCHASKTRRDRRRFQSSLERLEERVVMTLYPTTTVLAESLASGVVGTNVTFTAAVSSSNGVPIGSVVFQDGSTSLGTVSLSGGTATLSTSSLTVGSHLIRAVYAGTGTYYASASSGVEQSSTISTVAGNNTPGYSGDGGPATSAELNLPVAVAFDSQGNMYISDFDNYVIRKVTPAGVISTVVGNGTAGYSGDGGPATSAEISQPYGMAFDHLGNLFFADFNENVVREVNTAGIISTVVGTGAANYSGDGGPARSATLNNPTDVAFNAAGDLFITDAGNDVIREVDASGVISTIAGVGGSPGYSGDGGPATSALIDSLNSIAFDSSGNLFFVDQADGVVREINTAGIISTVAGNGGGGYSGDNGPATSASLYGPEYVAFDQFGNMFISDIYNYDVREVSPSGIITTIAGNGMQGYSGNGGPAIESILYGPVGLGVNSLGSLFIADSDNNVIREIAAPPLLTYSVTPVPTTVSFSVAAGPQSTTFNVTVDTASGSPVNGGTVSFYDGTLLLGVVPIVNGVVMFDSAALSPGQHTLSAVFSGSEDAAASSASQVVSIAAATSVSPSLTGLSRYPLHNKRTLVSLFFDQTLNPAEALWKQNYKLHNNYGDRINVSHIYFDQPSSTVTLLPAHRIVLRNTYTLKLVGLNSQTGGKRSSPTVTTSGWLANTFKAKINHKALSVPGAPPAVTFVNGKEVSRRG